MRHQRTSSSSLPSVLNHVARRRQYRSLLIAGVILLVLATIWLRDSIGVVGFGRGPHSQGHLPSANKESASDGKTDAPSPPPSTEPAIQTAQHTTEPMRPSTTPPSTKFSPHSSTPTTLQVSETGTQTPHPTPTADSLIPPKIWQILLPKYPGKEKPPTDPKSLEETQSWTSLNPNSNYTLIDQHAANAFVRSHFSHSNPSLVELYNTLPNVGMKSDLLRYLLLDIEGGVYSDIDTVALKPISSWIPAHLRSKVKLVVGIEFDRRDGGGWVDITHWVQLCQWTIAAAPGHPVFGKMVERVQRSLAELSESYRVPVAELKPSSYEVMNSTGPAAWTDVVFEMLQGYDETLKDTKDLSFMTEPRLIGDILVLTVDGFGMGQNHSNSTNDGSVPEVALVNHLFRGSWRGD